MTNSQPPMERELKNIPIFVDDFGKLGLAINPEEHCYFCDIEEPLQKHHIIRRKDGGLDDPDNLIVLCANCHYKLHHNNWYMKFSNGYYYLCHRQDEKKVVAYHPRQGPFKKNPPLKSIKKGVEIGKLYQEN